MEQLLFHLLLLSGVASFSSSAPIKFYLIQQNQTWSEAQTYCRTNHIDLLTAESSNDMTLLHAEAQKQNSLNAWIGLYLDMKSWRWSYKNEPLGAWTRWNTGLPSSSQNSTGCGTIQTSGWIDIYCGNRYRYMCFDETLTGNSRYILYTATIMAWYEARAYCRQYHTDLASARDSTETSVIVGKISTFRSWIGLMRDDWKWSDNTDVNNVIWAPGEPNGNKYEFCAYLCNGQVCDGQCSLKMPFFCYRIITGQKQIIRIKVLSKENLNRPAVRDSMLKLIQQSLKNRGTENIVVKFRQQPDGTAFEMLPKPNRV